MPWALWIRSDFGGQLHILRCWNVSDWIRLLWSFAVIVLYFQPFVAHQVVSFCNIFQRFFFPLHGQRYSFFVKNGYACVNVLSKKTDMMPLKGREQKIHFWVANSFILVSKFSILFNFYLLYFFSVCISQCAAKKEAPGQARGSTCTRLAFGKRKGCCNRQHSNVWVENRMCSYIQNWLHVHDSFWLNQVHVVCCAR